MAFWSWSHTPASNATADTSINYSEGQAPSSVNDSARAAMARLAEYRDDISGAIATGGTSTAYTVTSYQVFDTLAHMNGQMIAFTPHTTNGDTVTLNVDGLGAKPLRSAPSTALYAGTLIQGTPYIAIYNSSDAAFYLKGFFGNPFNIPLAGGLPYFGSTAPNTYFAFPFGQAVSRSVYSTLFALVGSTYGAGDGSTTFNIPDLRGRIPAGKDDMGGSAASRMTSGNGGVDGLTLGAAGGAETQTLTTAQIPSHSHANTLTDPGHTHGVSGGRWGSNSSTVALAGGSSANYVSGSNTFITIDGAVTGVSINNVTAGGGNAHTIMQPTFVCNYIMRVI